MASRGRGRIGTTSRDDRDDHDAAVAQLVERVLGKDEVLGSNPSGSFPGRVGPRFGRWRSVGPSGRPQAAREARPEADHG